MYYRNHIAAIFTILAISIFFLTQQAAADPIKDRMLSRIPAINSLKDKGLIGENNQGFLEYRSADQPEQQLISGENQDRESVYQAIAKSQNVDAVLVGQRRASQIAGIGDKGHWFQKADGSWYQK